MGDLAKKELEPDQKAEVFHNLGNSFLEAKKYQESIEAYKNALRNNPRDMDSKYNLEYARKKLEEQQQQDQQDKEDQQNQDQDQQHKQDQKDNDQDQQDKDQQQNKDQNQDQDQKNQKQQQQPKQISKKDAERMLSALKNDEKKTIEKLKK